MDSTRRRLRAALAVLSAVAIVALGLPGVATAATQIFSTSESEFTPGTRNQGWWSPTAVNFDANENYAVGSDSGRSFRNFFSFDLSSACPASSVTLELTRFQQPEPVTYSLFDVSTPAATLNANTAASQAIFDDLGSGTSFGSYPVDIGQEFDLLRFPLNAAGVSAFNAARGGFFSIGGSIPGASSQGSSIVLFSGSQIAFEGTQQLVATCALPTSKEQCENGGWRQFGFKNQGDCVSFVATGGKNPPGEKKP